MGRGDVAPDQSIGKFPKKYLIVFGMDVLKVSQ